jgi:hypothetical protein
MTAQDRTPSRRTLRPPGWTVALGLVAALGVLLWGGYRGGWTWTGFSDNDTLWDWLQLLLLPIAVAALPLWLRHGDRIGSRRRRALGAGVGAFAALVAIGYLVPWRWTGFPGNTLWDWLSLVLLPVVVVLAGMWEELRHRVGPTHHVTAAALLVAIVALIVVGYARPWEWTGFPGNTLWDWIKLLAVPLILPTIVVPAALGWFSAEVADEDAPSAAPDTSPSAPAPARLAPVLVAGAVALAVGVAAGALAFAGGDTQANRPAAAASIAPCARPAAATVAADEQARVVRAAGAFYACPRSGPSRWLTAAHGNPGPSNFQLGAGRAVFADQRCAGPAAPCDTRIVVTRLADGHRFVRHTFARAGHVSAIAISPHGALAIMLRAPAQLVLLDGHGTHIAAAGPGLDAGSLGSSGRTVYWRFDGRAATTQLTS